MTFYLEPSLEEIKEYLEEVTLKQGFETGLIYPLGTLKYTVFLGAHRNVTVFIYTKIRGERSI